MDPALYPPAPWHLQGCACLALHLIRNDVARAQIPSEFEIVSVWPGRTLAGIYLSSYEAGSVLEYHELLVAAGMVRYQGTVGFWISHIYVDNPASLSGGREIWGLPKELAEFEWMTSHPQPARNPIQIRVQQGDREFCQLTSPAPSWQTGSIPFSGQVFSRLDQDLLVFTGRFKGHWGILPATLSIPAESPFAELGLGSPFLTICGSNLTFTAEAPMIVGLHKDSDLISGVAAKARL